MSVLSAAVTPPRRLLVAVGVLALFAPLVLVAAFVARSAPAGAVFPGANGKIAFDSDRDGNVEVYMMNAEGSGQTRLTDSPGRDKNPAWSPDGTKVAFDSIRDGNLEIYVMSADGSGQTNVTRSQAIDFRPGWSPDGSQIAYASFRVTNFDIYAMNADGSGQTNLTNNPTLDFDPAWSPDGSQIAFQSDRDGDFEIYVMNADGSGLTNLTGNTASDSAPTWSPDGSRIAFASDLDGNFEIYTMNANGSDQIRLTSEPAVDGSPTWSPDGSMIAFVSDRDGNPEIYVMNADGSGQINLTNHLAQDSSPDWQPLIDTDGDTIPNETDLDDDNDGCLDTRENGLDETLGGRRDPKNFWDFFDPNRDRSVGLLDFLAVLRHFNTAGDPSTLDPDAPEPPIGEYWALADRGGQVPGGDPWDELPANGSIGLADFLSVLRQFGHTCA